MSKKLEANSSQRPRLELGDRHSRASGPARYCYTVDCEVRYTPLEECPACSERTDRPFRRRA